jgi:hypothetical protein
MSQKPDPKDVSASETLFSKIEKTKLPKDKKELRALLKRLGVKDSKLVKMALYRDAMALKGIELVQKRQYQRARLHIDAADGMQKAIESQSGFLEIFKAIFK